MSRIDDYLKEFDVIEERIKVYNGYLEIEDTNSFNKENVEKRLNDFKNGKVETIDY